MKSLVAVIMTLFVLISTSCMGLNVTIAQGDPLFYDNFDDGVANGWTQHDGSWSVTNGEYFVSVGVVEDALSTVDDLSFTDCTIETTLRFTDSVGFRAGIIFRFIDPTHYYGIHISNEYDSLGISKYTPEDPDYGEGLGSFKENTFQKDTDYQLKVVVSGNVFKCFVDGVQVLTVVDDSYTFGGVGLRARRADVYFDNFTVENATNFEPSNPDLLAWWKLDEGNGTTVFDSSGYGYKGTIHGANWMNYQGDTSLDFDGVSDYVSLPSLYLTNLDSFTVVTWINSELTDVGFIMYHGNLGEFEIGVGDLGQSTQDLNLKPDYAGFSVKLSGSGWIGVQASSPMKPNTWHQIVGVWEKGASLKVYVDGILAGEKDDIPSGRLYNPGGSFPSSIGIYSQDRFNQKDFFKGQISNVMVFNKALTAQEINELANNVQIPLVARPVLDLSCKSSASYSGLTVEISGKLALGETAVTNEPILLSYSVNGGKSWQDLTLVSTALDGTYSATWNPSVTGIYTIRAVFEGGAAYLGTSAVVNLSVTRSGEENVFSVTSNSTVSSLTFNSTSRILSFSVTGSSGTAGYADVNVAKSLVQNAADFEVYLDGNKLDCMVSSSEDSWLLHFEYNHSSHDVTVNLGDEYDVDVTLHGNNGNELFYGAVVAVLVIIVAVALAFRVKKKPKKT